MRTLTRQHPRRRAPPSTAQWKSEGPIGVVGADPADAKGAQLNLSKSAKKNAARKANRVEGEPGAAGGGDSAGAGGQQPAKASAASAAGGLARAADGGVGGEEGLSLLQQEVLRRTKPLTKKLREIDELQAKGAVLNEGQLSKMSKRGEVLASIELLESFLPAAGSTEAAADPVKKVRALHKKMRQLDELRAKGQGGAELSDEQRNKLAGAAALGRELEQLTQLLQAAGIEAS